MKNAAFNKMRALFTDKLGLELRKKLLNCYIWSIALCDAETGTLWAAAQWEWGGDSNARIYFVICSFLGNSPASDF